MSLIKPKLIKLDTGEIVSSGWYPSLPSLNNYTSKSTKIAAILAETGLDDVLKNLQENLKPSFSLRSFCSPVEIQGTAASCTAQAAVGAVEYFERRANNDPTDFSRLFLYTTTRQVMGITGDTGANNKDTLEALRIYGIPPESDWPYLLQYINESPPPSVYNIAKQFKLVQYFSHSQPGAARPDILKSIKQYIAAGIPVIFGFSAFPSFSKSTTKGDIPYPDRTEMPEWGHAVLAVGYDDDRVITNTMYNIKTTGALQIRNSIGDGWGDGGYGYLPYDYILNGLAKDCWSIINMEWIKAGNFIPQST